MDGRDAIWAIPALLGFVFVSSLLGLGGWLLFDPFAAFMLMAGVWAVSPLANGIFVAGSSLAAIYCYHAARQGRYVPALLIGGVTHWAVYTASFMALGSGPSLVFNDSARQQIHFVGAWGIVGLIFAAVAPPLAAVARYRMARDVRSGGAEEEAS